MCTYEHVLAGPAQPTVAAAAAESAPLLPKLPKRVGKYGDGMSVRGNGRAIWREAGKINVKNFNLPSAKCG